jgi:cytochrome bd-type quinol oxidase subunit 2
MYWFLFFMLLIQLPVYVYVYYLFWKKVIKEED